MCFGGGSNNEAKKALDYQKKMAAEAARKERERQQRLRKGTRVIDNLFDGKPVMAEREAVYDWKAFNEALAKRQAQLSASQGNNQSTDDGFWNDDFFGLDTIIDRKKNQNVDPFAGLKLPEGFTVKEITTGGSGNPGITIPGFPDFKIPGKNKAPTTSYVLVGPDGRQYKPGDELKYMEKYDTGERKGGFGDNFYNKYRRASLGYYMPELEKQFTKAKSNLNFDHARAGTLQSSMASENVADLVYQNTMNKALLRSKADNATTQLKNSVAAQKSAALTQLYSTEDPTIAANTATNSVRTLQNTTPEFSPMGELFKNAVVGASNYASAYNDQQNWGTPPGAQTSGRVVG
jgi:hypothetical protein